MEAFGNGDEPEGRQPGEEGHEQEDRQGPAPRLQGLVPPFESNSAFIWWYRESGAVVPCISELQYFSRNSCTNSARYGDWTTLGTLGASSMKRPAKVWPPK